MTKTATKSETIYDPFSGRGLPAPLAHDGRCSMAIVWYASEEDAAKVDAHVVKEGRTYNGGYFHGMSCGRETRFDYTPKDGPHAGKKLYAVTY